MLFVASDKLIRNEILYVKKLRVPIKNLQLFARFYSSIRIFSSRKLAGQRKFGWGSSRLPKHEVSYKMTMI